MQSSGIIKEAINMSEKYVVPEPVRVPHVDPEKKALCEALAGLHERVEALEKGEE